MAKHVGWYFKGWSYTRAPGPDGKLRTQWTYSGPHYTYGLSAEKLRRFKGLCVAASAAEAVLWVLFSFAPGTGKDAAFYVGAPWYVAIIPLMVLLVGAVGMLSARERMTYRDMYAGYNYLKYSAIGLLTLLGLSFLGELVYALVLRAGASLARELMWLLRQAVCIAADVFLLALLGRHEPMQLPEEQ